MNEPKEKLESTPNTDNFTESDEIKQCRLDLLDISRSVQESLVDLITTADYQRLEKIKKYLNWLIIKTQKVKEEPDFDPSNIPDLKRGDVILIDLGFNIGDEFGGEHTAIVLRDSCSTNKRVVILPITSQEPKNKELVIYVKIGKISGMNPNKYHWANIFNVQSISKQRIKYPPEPKSVNGIVLDRISQKLMTQLALRRS